jgi:cold shock CspA family protein
MLAQVSTYVEPRGFGFLTDSEGVDYFFHISNLVRDPKNVLKLKLGVMVTFEITDPIKLGGKMQAIKMRIVDEPGVEVAQIGAGGAQ